MDFEKNENYFSKKVERASNYLIAEQSANIQQSLWETMDLLEELYDFEQNKLYKDKITLENWEEHINEDEERDEFYNLL